MKVNHVAACLFTTTILTAVSAPASAQTAPDAAAAQPQQDQDEIVVIARGRAESLQDTPVSVTVIDAATIENAGIHRASDFFSLVPNVTMADAQDSGNVAINIRGVGQIRNGETPVAISVDGVLLSSPIEFKQEFLDISQIEVLRGPQGALYGRNAIAGAINITTRRPTNEFSGSYHVGVGNGDAFDVSAVMGGALIDNVLLVRGGVSHSQAEGWIENSYLRETVDNFDDTTARLRIDWQVTPDFSIDARAFYNTRQGGAAYFARPLLQASKRPFLDPAARVDVANTVVAPESNNLGFDDRELQDYSIKAEWDVGEGVLTSITSYNRINHTVAFDGYDYSDNTQCYLFGFGLVSDGLANCTNPALFAVGPSGNVNGPDRQFVAAYNTTFQDYSLKNRSQEFRFTSRDDRRLRYILGTYYLGRDRTLVTGTNEDKGFGIIPRLDFNPATLNQTRGYFAEDNKDYTYALFGQFSYDLTDDVEVSLSGRYDNDHREQTDPRPNAYRVDGYGLPITGARTREATFDMFQPKATVRWKPDDHATFYVTYAEGFRSGGFNAPGTDIAPFTGARIADSVYRQEESQSLEAGAKLQWFDNRLTANAAIFGSRVDDLQVFNFNGAVNAQVVNNVDRVDVIGGEVELVYRPTDQLTFNIGGGYTDAEIKKFAAKPAAVGNQVPYTTQSTVNLGVQYVHPLSQNLELVNRLDYERRGKTFFHEGGTFVGVPVRDPIDFVSGRIALNVNHRWSLAVWGRNLLDETYYEEVVAPDYNYQGRPRTYGVELNVNF